MRTRLRKKKSKVNRKAKIFTVSETTLLAESALAKDWNRPEDDAAWAHLHTDKRNFRATTRTLRERLTRFSITYEDLRSTKDKGHT